MPSARRCSWATRCGRRHWSYQPSVSSWVTYVVAGATHCGASVTSFRPRSGLDAHQSVADSHRRCSAWHRRYSTAAPYPYLPCPGSAHISVPRLSLNGTAGATHRSRAHPWRASYTRPNRAHSPAPSRSSNPEPRRRRRSPRRRRTRTGRPGRPASRRTAEASAVPVPVKRAAPSGATRCAGRQTLSHSAKSGSSPRGSFGGWPRPYPVRVHRGFRQDIQGLRALAVLLVALDHARIGPFTGGFVGVDVFFVISGFLITSLLVREAERSGRVSLLGFYARRARRILPAATRGAGRDGRRLGPAGSAPSRRARRSRTRSGPRSSPPTSS